MEISIGSRIKQLREENGTSQLELAKIFNISNTALSQYESGNRTPSDDLKIKLADYFNVSLDFLMGRTESYKINNCSSTEIYNSNDSFPQSKKNLTSTLLYLRKSHNLTQEMVADKLNLSRVRYNNYETGKRSPDYQTLTMIARLYNVSIDYLIGYTNNLKTQTLYFKDILYNILLEKGISQLELSNGTNITTATISRYISGKRKPSAENVKIIADFLGVSIDYLLGNENYNNVPKEKNEKDIAEIIKQLKNILKNKENITFNGCPLEDDTINTLLYSIHLQEKIIHSIQKNTIANK